MLNVRTTALMTLALASAAALVGCAADVTVDEDVAAIESALNQEDGGYTASDETPGFGDPEVSETPELVDDFADAEDMISAQLALPEVVHRRVMLMWGNLPPLDQSMPGGIINWSGDVHLAVGALGLRRTLVFDREDGVLPRTSPQAIAFKSHTLPHVDGLLMDVVGPQNAVLSFDTAAMSVSIDLAALDVDGQGYEPLGDGANGLAYAGHVVHPGCAEGFLFGHWKNVGAEVGRFRGRVAASDGAPLGHVKGIYGYADKVDAQLFFGKYINHQGQFRGLLGGQYGGGVYHGLWKTVLPQNNGKLGGRYFDGRLKDDGRGIFVGHWAEACGVN